MDDPTVASGHTVVPERQPSRPHAPAPVPDRIRDWIDWFGVGRLVAATVAVAAVCAGGYWLVRTPPPPTEAALPRATTTAPAVATSGPEDASGGGGHVGGTAAAASLTVHVAGAVVSPGVYQLLGDARVHDAVAAAGGVTAGADPDALNLAGVLADGTRVYVPRVGEVVEPSVGDDQPSGPVDVNRATPEELDELPGVGPATATAIVTERDRNGPFAGVDELERVPGIGPAKLAALRDLVTT